jgi:hypothetical protein
MPQTAVVAFAVKIQVSIVFHPNPLTDIRRLLEM